MGRWEPDAAGRFRAAALALFAEIGYEQTTVAAIAERAGLTARTFFRYFADKREVLFDGAQALQQGMVAALEGSPADAPPLASVAAALASAADFFADDRRAFARQRQAVIAANAELHERELIKLAKLSAALATALRARGVGEPDASLAAEAGMAVFRIAFVQWVALGERRPFAAIVRASLERLEALASAGRATSA